MPAAEDVQPGKWSDLVVLFDNSWYSVVAGKYEAEPALGERWNGEGDGPGFPSQGGHPTFHVVPDFLQIPLIHGLIHELANRPYSGCEVHLAEIMRQLRRQLRRQRDAGGPEA